MTRPSASATRACYFKLGSYYFAAESLFVKQIIPVKTFSPVPRSCASLWGLIAVDSAILPLINSYEIFGLPKTETDLAIVLEQDNKLMALALDEVLGFAPLEADYQQVTEELPTALKPLSKGTAFYQDKTFDVLDIQRLLSLVEHQLEVV
ncbi:MAG: chemotaxis protein CheW [Trueperaceae bacterium]|nr:chemotaxis protein CheW [Trueperaceae bacterium]